MKRLIQDIIENADATPPHLVGLLRLGSPGDMLGSLKLMCNEIPPKYVQNTTKMSKNAPLWPLGDPFGNGSLIMMKKSPRGEDLGSLFGSPWHQKGPPGCKTKSKKNDKNEIRIRTPNSIKKVWFRTLSEPQKHWFRLRAASIFTIRGNLEKGAKKYTTWMPNASKMSPKAANMP